MARTVSTVCELIAPNKVSDAQTPVALTASTPVFVPAVGRAVIIGVTPAANGTVKVYKGDGVASMNDITYAVTKDKIAFIQLDTSSFEVLEGDNVGSIKLECSAAGTLVAVNAL